MKRRNSIFFLLIVSVLGFHLPARSQEKSKKNLTVDQPQPFTSPKLVVGIIVDQMRYDYLTRFWNRFGEGGFKRLANQGFNCKNNQYNYTPTSTAPGHASVYTGTTPASHGIIGNGWYDRALEREVYCVSDDTINSVGTTADTGKMSPRRMQVTTITDQLRLHTQLQGKVIAVALKDRGAVLPGGHMANAAYWFEGGGEGNWISSSYYMDALPKYVRDFNAKKDITRYKKPWTTLENISTYTESGPDKTVYEGLFTGEKNPVFPHDLTGLWDSNGGYEIIRVSPYGNNMTTDFALAALEGEALGQDNITDFLAISYSSTDYVGHKYGVNSKEVQDIYMRLDKDLEILLKALDEKVGKSEYTVFLSADHAAVQVPAYLRDQKVPAGYYQSQELLSKLKLFANKRFGSTALINTYSNNQLYLDHKVMDSLDLRNKEVEEILARELLGYEPVARVYTSSQMLGSQYTRGIGYIVQNGYHQKRSGDIFVVMKPGYLSYMETGTSHGTAHVYDTHVPLLFYGKGIKTGSTVSLTEIPDIAPTIAALLGIAFPNGTYGKPVSAALD